MSSRSALRIVCSIILMLLCLLLLFIGGFILWMRTIADVAGRPVHGIVRTVDGKPIGDVDVKTAEMLTLFGFFPVALESERIQNTWTDSEGRFEVEGGDPVTNFVEIEKSGYELSRFHRTRRVTTAWIEGYTMSFESRGEGFSLWRHEWDEVLGASTTIFPKPGSRAKPEYSESFYLVQRPESFFTCSRIFLEHLQ